MKKIIVIALLMLDFAPVFAAEDDWKMTPEVDFNLPSEVHECLSNSTYKEAYKIVDRINPLYLRADIKGDGKMEYVIFIRRERDKREGLLICYLSGGSEILFAGNAVKDIGSKGHDLFEDNLNDVNYWFVYKESLGSGFEGMTPPPPARGEIISIGGMESWSKALYWTGREYVTYQLGD